jgi:hypothetical protein
LRCLCQAQNQSRWLRILKQRDCTDAVKCRDGFPCKNCKRTGRLCTAPVKGTPSTAIFIGWNTDRDSKNKKEVLLLQDTSPPSVPQSIALADKERTFPYFFTSFLSMNAIVRDKSINARILGMAKSSPALQDAIHAVAALHQKQQDQLTVSGVSGNTETYKALQAYNRSVCCMQSCIKTNTFLDDPSALWTTFLLGLFEVRSILDDFATLCTLLTYPS